MLCCQWLSATTTSNFSAKSVQLAWIIAKCMFSKVSCLWWSSWMGLTPIVNFRCLWVSLKSIQELDSFCSSPYLDNGEMKSLHSFSSQRVILCRVWAITEWQQAVSLFPPHSKEAGIRTDRCTAVKIFSASESMTAADFWSVSSYVLWWASSLLVFDMFIFSICSQTELCWVWELEQVGVCNQTSALQN